MKKKILNAINKSPFGIHYSKIGKDILKLRYNNKEHCREIVRSIIGEEDGLRENKDGYWMVRDAAEHYNEKFIDDTVFTIVDIETTGGNPSNSHIIEIGACKIFKGKITSRFGMLVKPPCNIPGFITYLTGISDNMVASAPSPDEAISRFADFLKDSVFVAHNAHFDAGFIEKDFKKYFGKKMKNDVLCTLRLSRRLLPRLRFYNLDTLSQYFEIDHPTRHRAVDDAWITSQLFLIILQKLAEKQISTVKEMDAFQSGGSYFDFNFDLNLIRDFPQKSGYFELKDRNDNVIYRCWTENIKQDLQNFIFTNRGKKHQKIINQTYGIEFKIE